MDFTTARELMPLQFREERTTQAAARLIQREGGKINHMKLIKLLYIAERRALLRWGRPITFDWYVSMPHGPVLSFTLDKINQQATPGAESYWHQHISERRNHEVCLRNPEDIPNDQLSPAEEALLDEVYDAFGKMNQWELRDYSHALPEWQDPNGSRLPIRIEDILLSEGLSDDDVREVMEALAAESFAERLTVG